MPGAQAPSTVIPFGPFEVDLHAQELRKLGVRLRLPRQSFQILKMLLERPGELVTREEMRSALWPSDTFVDFEHGLNAAINRLREALGDDADNPRYIETLPRRGYRFLAPLTQPTPVQVTVAVTEKKNIATAGRARRQKLLLITVPAIVVCAVLAAAVYWIRMSLRQPRVLAYRQLTSDRQEKGQTPCGVGSFVVTDGPRIFFSEPAATVAQVASTGGDTVKLPIPFSCFRIFDISPDKSELLGVSQTNGNALDQPLWSLSIASGLAHRLSNVNALRASWSPDGQRFAYTTGNSVTGPNDLYVASRDGNEARKLITFPDRLIYMVRWSPDGAVLRMVVSGELWEVTAEGTNLHKIVLFPNENRSLSGMNWTADGRYFVFAASKPNSAAKDLWILKETKSPFGRNSGTPVQLSTGATSFGNLAPSPNGKQIFAVGGQYRGELLRFDLKSGKLEPFLGGISADQLDFSRDGKWVAYITFPEGILWRSRTDGSERMQLNVPPLVAGLPHWSPDGTRIAFSGALPGQPFKIYVVSANGGKPELVSEGQNHELDPTWMPGGDSLVFGGRIHSSAARISSVDLRTGKASTVPGSDGLYSPRVSPDGRFIVALDATAQRKVLLFDRATQKWSELMAIKNSRPSWEQWSVDSGSIYVTDLEDMRVAVVYRIHVSGRRIERVASFIVPEGITGYWGGWETVAPDGSPLLMRDLSLWEIYALDVDLP